MVEEHGGLMMGMPIRVLVLRNLHWGFSGAEAVEPGEMEKIVSSSMLIIIAMSFRFPSMARCAVSIHPTISPYPF